MSSISNTYSPVRHADSDELRVQIVDEKGKIVGWADGRELFAVAPGPFELCDRWEPEQSIVFARRVKDLRECGRVEVTANGVERTVTITL